MDTENVNDFVRWLGTYKDHIIVITGVLLAAVVYACKLISAKVKPAHGNMSSATATNNVSNAVTVNVDSGSSRQDSASQDDQSSSVDDNSKLNTHVLFIDDEKFPVIQIMKNAGWINTFRLRSVKSVNDPAIKNAHIIFVDINGVAKDLFPTDHGLGLVVALKKTYGKSKKVVIYSAETSGNRFHEAFRLRDDQLDKNADSYEFQSTAERLAVQLRNGQ